MGSSVRTERYDRVAQPNGWMRRIHQEDLRQALGLPPELKYQSEGGPTPRAIVDLLRQVLPGAPADDAVVRFLDALVLNC